VFDTLGGSAGDWRVSGVWDWWVPAGCSQLLYYIQDLRKDRLRPSVRTASIAVLIPLGEVSVRDVVSFWARVLDESLDMTRHSGPAWVSFHPW
jgi:hypothetical protein